MTREEVIKIIDQNRDILTPENYQGILKNVDIFSKEDKENIARYLEVANRLIEVNKEFVSRRNALLRDTGKGLGGLRDLLGPINPHNV
jgi:hypothetical protein